MIIVKNKKWKNAFILIGVLLFLCCACALRKVEVDTSSPGAEQNDVKDPIEVPPEKENTDDPSTEPENPPDKEENNVKIEPEKTQPASTKPFWVSETTRLTNNITAIATAGQADYRANGSQKGWMSKNGELFNYYEGKYITTDTLVSDGYLESGLTASAYKILLMNGADLAALEGTSVPSSSLDFQVFAAVKQSGKYIVASSDGKVGTISEDSFHSLLAKYNQNNGKVLRLSSASEEYERILNYISLFEGRFEEYYVREIRLDERYAVVVFSNRKNTADIKEYILENENNFWEVVLPNAQTEYYPITSINRYLPNFNLELLPAYTLASWRGNIVSTQGGVEAALFSAKAITSSSEIAYQCGTSACAYAILTNGNRYACYSEDGRWKAEFVTSDIAAKNFLLKKTGINYGFLILDD